MKKLLAVMLCLAMLVCSAAFAETAATVEAPAKESLGTLDVNGAFELKGVVPEGYKLNVIAANSSSILAVISAEEQGHASVVLSIAYEELMSEVQRMNDISEEGLAQIEATFTESDNVEISYRETAYGTKLMVVRQAEGRYVDFYTVYKGYEMEFVLVPATGDEDGQLDEAQIQMVVDFMSDLDFVEVAAKPAE